MQVKSYNGWLRDTSDTKLSIICQENLVVLLEVQSALASAYQRETTLEHFEILTLTLKVRDQIKKLHRLATSRERM